MSVPLKSTIGRIKVSTTTYAAKNLSLQYASAAEVSMHSGLQLPTNIRVAGAVVPVLTFQMYGADAYAVFGWLLGSVPTLTAYFANLVGAIIDSSSTHHSVSLQGTPSGAVCCAHVDSWSVSEGGEWIATCKAYFFSADGSTDPVKQTATVALPALSAVPVIHGIGLCSPNGTDLLGSTGFSYQSGLSISFQRTDGLTFATGGSPSGMRPAIMVENADGISVAALLGSQGVPITVDTDIVLNKYATSGRLTGTGAKTLTIPADYGFMAPRPASGDFGQLFKGGFEILMASTDGITHPLAVA